MALVCVRLLSWWWLGVWSESLVIVDLCCGFLFLWVREWYYFFWFLFLFLFFCLFPESLQIHFQVILIAHVIFGFVFRFTPVFEAWAYLLQLNLYVLKSNFPIYACRYVQIGTHVYVSALLTSLIRLILNVVWARISWLFPVDSIFSTAWVDPYYTTSWSSRYRLWMKMAARRLKICVHWLAILAKRIYLSRK